MNTIFWWIDFSMWAVLFFCFIAGLYFILKIGEVSAKKRWLIVGSLIVLTFSYCFLYPQWERRGSLVPNESFTNGIGMKMAKLSRGFYVSTYETTQEQFEKIMGFNPSTYRAKDNPVEMITWDDAIEFCTRLTIEERSRSLLPSGFIYSLPSFKEWLIYVADAELKGSVTPVGYGKELHSPLKVGSGEVNRLGIYDSRGNVREMSRDESYYKVTHKMFGASFNECRDDYLSVRNQCCAEKRYERNNEDGMRCVLVSDRKVVEVDTRDLPLHRAAMAGNLKQVSELIRAGEDCNPRNFWGDTPLHMAVRYGHAEVAELLIKAGADVNARRVHDWTALHYACLKVDQPLILLLVRSGAKVNVQTLEKQTPLHLLCERRGDAASVKALLDAGADVNVMDSFK